MNANPANFGGAYDLSSLVNRSRQSADANPNDPAGSVASGATPAAATLSVSNLVLDISPAGLANYVKLSEQVPVLVEFYTQRSAGSQELSTRLATETRSRGGDILLIRVDGDAPQVGQLLQAFQAQGLPTVGLLLRGQPHGLFTGNQEAELLKQVVDRVILLARENGVIGRAEVSENAAPPAEPQLPPHHKAAFEAIEAGEYATAVAEFQAALNESPADAVANTGLAQAMLLLRTDGLELDKVLAKPAETLADVLQKADVLALIGHLDKAFSAILDAFEVAPKEEREQLRTHLLELFKVASEHPSEVAAARVRLTNLLY